MYFTKVEFENVGPLQYLNINFPKLDGNRPAPVVLVGENGSGKTILLSHLVNSMISGKQKVYEDCEVDKGKVYKSRSPQYILTGKNYYCSRIELDEGIYFEEWQLDRSRKNFEEELLWTSIRKGWSTIPETDASILTGSYREREFGKN